MKLIRRSILALVLVLSAIAPSCPRVAFAQTQPYVTLEHPWTGSELRALWFLDTKTVETPSLVPSFVVDVYAISPYGDVALQNPMYHATAETADALAVRHGAVPVLRDTTPQTGPALRRWHVSEVPASLLPPTGMRVSDPQKILLLLDLPTARMWAIRFPSGCEVNAGFLADYYRRNPESKFPGLADKFVKAIIAGECAN